MKDKPNKGWIKELSKTPTKLESVNKAFNYSKPVSKIDKIQNMAVNSRTREFKTVKQDKSTSFSKEQNLAKASHKGNK